MVVPHKNIEHGHTAYASGLCRCRKCYGARRTSLAQQARKKAAERTAQAAAQPKSPVRDSGWDTYTREELSKMRGWG